MESNQRYYSRRAVEERMAAQRAVTETARAWHSKLAADFAERASACTAFPKRSSKSANQRSFTSPEAGAIGIYVNAADFCPHFGPKNPQFCHHAVTLPVPYARRRP